MTLPDGPLWLHLPQGRYQLRDDVDRDSVLEALRGDDGLVLEVEDESGAPGVVVLRAGAAPLAVLGEPGRGRGRPPQLGPNRHG